MDAAATSYRGSVMSGPEHIRLPWDTVASRGGQTGDGSKMQNIVLQFEGSDLQRKKFAFPQVLHKRTLEEDLTDGLSDNVPRLTARQDGTVKSRKE